MAALWHLALNFAVIIGSITWAVLCFEQKKPLLLSVFLLLFGITTFGVHIYLGISGGACEGFGVGGILQRLVAIESCVDTYSYDLLLAQSAIVGSLLVWLVSAWSRRKGH